MSVVARLSRYGEWADVRAACVSGSVRGTSPFFGGAHAYDRMALVRKAIHEIRSSWERYPQFMSELRELVSVATCGSHEADSTERWAELFATRKRWATSAEDAQRQGAAAVKLYTSEGGYRDVFSVINLALRTNRLTNESSRLRCATFLVELLTIDLYNLRLREPQTDAFRGTIYRGMCLTYDELAQFKLAASGPITERYVAIPLAMMSATTSPKVAMEFAQQRAAELGDTVPVLWEIHADNLDPNLLALYKSRFPRAVVTSICAVPIWTCSDFRHEQEILLRGAHFQIVDMRVDNDTPGGPVHKVKAVMLNTNRDHLTAVASNTGADKCERELFRDIIIGHRSAICAKLAEDCGRFNDAATYRSIAVDRRECIEATA